MLQIFKAKKESASFLLLLLVQAKYTDPMTGIYFNTSEEFQLVRTLPSDIVQGYLALRGKLAIT